MAKRLIYYDTETTGVRAEKDRIIELAAYDPVNDRRFDRLINPQIPIPQEASAIHGITDDMVKEAPTFAEIGKEFIDFCDGEPILIAHNNDGFDKHFLAHEYKRHELEMPTWIMLDSLKWARKYRPDLPRHSLQFLRQIYGIEENNAHRAIDDVLVLYQIFSFMVDDLPPETILKLLGDPGGSERPESMPFGKYQGKPLSEIPASYVSWLLESGALDKPENAQLKLALKK